MALLVSGSKGFDERDISEFRDVFWKFGLHKIWVNKAEQTISVTFADERDAEDAKKALDGSTMQGQRISIEWTSKGEKISPNQKLKNDLYDFIAARWTTDAMDQPFEDEENIMMVADSTKKFLAKQRKLCNALDKQMVDHLLFLIKSLTKIDLIREGDVTGFYLLDKTGEIKFFLKR